MNYLEQLRARSPSLYFKVRSLNARVLANKGYRLPLDVCVSLLNRAAVRRIMNRDALNFLSKCAAEYQDWLVVGSGPSIDEINFQKLRNHNVLLLNKSFELYDKIPATNNIISFITDTHVFNQHHSRMPVDLATVVVLTKHNLTSSALGFFRGKSNTDLRYLVIPKHFKRYGGRGKVGAMISCVNFGLYSVPYHRLGSELPRPLTWFNRRTVTLSASVLAASLGARNITVLGFDGGSRGKNPNDSGYYSKAISSGPSRPWTWRGWDDSVRRKIDLWGLRVLRLCVENGVNIINASPKTLLYSLPKADSHPLYRSTASE